MHIAPPPPQDAKLPLPKWEIERTHRYRDMLDTLIEGSNKLALILQNELLQEAADRQTARQAAAAPPQPPPQPKPEAKIPKNDAPEAAPPRPPRHPPFRPDLLYKTLIQTMESCIRLDAWLADRLHQTHTTAELAGLNHPNRPDILNYLHNAARLRDPHTDRIQLHNDLETRVSQELGLFPNRNPGDIIGDLANLFGLPFDDADFPNNWRCETFTPPGPEPELAQEMTDEEAAEITDEDLAEFMRLQDQSRARPRPRSSYHRRE